MFSASLIAGALCIAIWTCLLLAHGRFWRLPGAPSLSEGFPQALGPPRSVAVIIPARNEADVIGRAVTSLLRQDDVGSVHIFVVDDNSTDGTSEAARQAATETNRLTVIRGRPLPPGWSGKLWAVQQGVEQATALQPDFLLLTDADIEHDPDNVGCLVRIAQSGPAISLPSW